MNLPTCALPKAVYLHNTKGQQPTTFVNEILLKATHPLKSKTDTNRYQWVTEFYMSGNDPFRFEVVINSVILIK